MNAFSHSTQDAEASESLSSSDLQSKFQGSQGYVEKPLLKKIKKKKKKQILLEKGRQHTDLEILGDFPEVLESPSIFHNIERLFAFQFYKCTKTI